MRYRQALIIGFFIGQFRGPTRALADQWLALVVDLNQFDPKNLTPKMFTVCNSEEMVRMPHGRPGFQITFLKGNSDEKPTGANIHRQNRTVLATCQKWNMAGYKLQPPRQRLTASYQKNCPAGALS